jgi:hypothetical protein
MADLITLPDHLHDFSSRHRPRSVLWVISGARLIFCLSNGLRFREKPAMAKTIIEIRPHRGGWQVFEGAPGVQPYFGDRKHAVDYAIGRAKLRKGEIRILDSDGELLELFPFDDSDKHTKK